MMYKHKLRKGDTVVVIAGKDKGKRARIVKVFAARQRAIVEGVNLVKKHLRRRRQDQQAGIVQMSAALDISNLMLVCKHCNKPTRVGFNIMPDRTKRRLCKKCTGTL
jgi:large subunit ribosomal protein L24